MAKQAAEYTLANGKTVIVEADVPTDYGEERVSILGSGKGGGPPSLSDALDRVVPALGEVAAKITSLSIKPDEVELEVGIKFVGEAGVVIARASTEANLTVTLKWNKAK